MIDHDETDDTPFWPEVFASILVVVAMIWIAAGLPGVLS